MVPPRRYLQYHEKGSDITLPKATLWRWKVRFVYIRLRAFADMSMIVTFFRIARIKERIRLH